MEKVSGDDSPLRPVNLTKTGSFAEIRREGYTPFSLGHVYVYAGVKESLPVVFAKEHLEKHKNDKPPEYDELKPIRVKCPTEILHTTMHFERVVVSIAKEWSTIFDVMDTPSFQYFKQWLMAQHFASVERNTFFVPRFYMAPIVDPIVLDTKKFAVPDYLDVITVTGMRGGLKPVDLGINPSKVKEFISFEQIPPEESIVVMGSKALKSLRTA